MIATRSIPTITDSDREEPPVADKNTSMIQEIIAYNKAIERLTDAK